MPERNGPETAKWIRNFEFEKHMKKVPIIALTGHESEDIKLKCFNAGMDLILTKPIKKSEVLSALKNII